jgi:hypothetical protein
VTRQRALPILAATLLAGLAWATVALAAARTTTETSSFGGVKATFTFSGSAPKIANMRLKIVRSGRAVYNEPVTSRYCGRLCQPGAFGRHTSSVRVLDIESDGQPDVILELYTGGASCCLVDQVFSFDPGVMTYIKSEHDFLTAGASIAKLGGSWRFVSADGHFLCAFTDCADSGEPIQIWKFGGRRQFFDVTRNYPGLISRDAAKWMRLFKHHVANGVGLIAPWAADEELLGHNALVQSTLKGLAAKGELRAGRLSGQPTGQRFIAALNKLLRKLGYEH